MLIRLYVLLRRQPPLLATTVEILSGPALPGIITTGVITALTAATRGMATAGIAAVAGIAVTIVIGYALARCAQQVQEHDRLAERARTGMHALLLLPTIPATHPATTTPGITPTGSGDPFPHLLPIWVTLAAVVIGVLFLTARTPSILRYPLWFVLALAVIAAYMNSHQHPNLRAVCLLGVGTSLATAVLARPRRRRGRGAGPIRQALMVLAIFTFFISLFPLLFTIGGNG